MRNVFEPLEHAGAHLRTKAEVEWLRSQLLTAVDGEVHDIGGYAVTDMRALARGVPFTASPLVERGKVLVMNRGGGTHLVFGVALARGIPYRITGNYRHRLLGSWPSDVVPPMQHGTLERCYVLGWSKGSAANVLNEDGRAYDIWFEPAAATEVPRW